MRVDIDKARGDDAAAGIDFLGATALDDPYRGNLAVPDRHIGRDGRAAATIEHGSAPDDDVECGLAGWFRRHTSTFGRFVAVVLSSLRPSA